MFYCRPSTPVTLPNDTVDSVAPREILRKGLHVLVAGFPLVMLEIGRASSLFIIIPVTLAAVLADLVRSRASSFERLIARLFGHMMRVNEAAQGDQIVINGATWVLVSLSTLTLLYDLTIAGMAFMMFMIADAAAAITGSALGRHQWCWSRRTFEGSAAFAASAFSVGLLFPTQTFDPLILLLVSVLGALVESLPGPLNDNVRVPHCMALAFVAAAYFIN